MHFTQTHLLFLLTLTSHSIALPLERNPTTTIPETRYEGPERRQVSPFLDGSGRTSRNAGMVLPANPKALKRPTSTSIQTTLPTSSPSPPTTTALSSSSSSPPLPSTPATSSTPNPGLTDGETFWRLKTTFSSLASFSLSIARANWSWGAINARTIDFVPSKRYSASGLMGGAGGGGGKYNNGSVLAVRHPEGSINPSNLPVGGTGFYGLPLDLSRANNVTMSYSVFFPIDFDFVKGGKLPGMYGGTRGCSGGNPAVDCWSSRLMWRSGGQGELYLYAPRDKQTTATCTLGPISYCNSKTGMSIGRGSWSFKRGEWTDLRQDIWMNTPGKQDGGFNIWANGKLVLSSSAVFYRNLPNIKVGAPGTIPLPRVELIDYDSLPANITIPNGGFARRPSSLVAPPSPSPSPSSSPTSATVAPEPTMSVALVAKLALPDDLEAIKSRAREQGMRKLRRRQESFDIQAEATRNTTASPLDEEVFDPTGAAEDQKIRTSSFLPIGFIGIMFNTFFGGGDESWASPRTQYAYFNQVSLRITD